MAPEGTRGSRCPFLLLVFSPLLLLSESTAVRGSISSSLLFPPFYPSLPFPIGGNDRGYDDALLVAATAAAAAAAAAEAAATTAILIALWGWWWSHGCGHCAGGLQQRTDSLRRRRNQGGGGGEEEEAFLNDIFGRLAASPISAV